MISKRGMHGLLKKAGFAELSIRTALHLQAAISLQNFLVAKGVGGQSLKYGKGPYYSLLLMAVVPFCLFEWSLGQGGMMDFVARKPVGSR